MYTSTCVCAPIHSFHDTWDYMYTCEYGLKEAGLHLMPMKQQGHRHCIPSIAGAHRHTNTHRHKRTWERECNLKILLSMMSMVTCSSGVRCRALKLAVKGPSRNLPYVGGVQPVAMLLAVLEVGREYTVQG